MDKPDLETLLLTDAIEKVIAAIDNPGPYPTFHKEMCDAVAHRWPTLWNALIELKQTYHNAGL